MEKVSQDYITYLQQQAVEYDRLKRFMDSEDYQYFIKEKLCTESALSSLSEYTISKNEKALEEATAAIYVSYFFNHNLNELENAKDTLLKYEEKGEL